MYEYFSNILNRKKNENFLPAYKLFVESDSYNIDFSNIDMPTLIMTGKHDVGSTPEMNKKLHQEITDSELYIIPNAKHMAAFEQDRLVNSKISSCLLIIKKKDLNLLLKIILLINLLIKV